MEHKPIDFTPVPVRYRHDGWTPQRQKAFIEALAETACVEESCMRVGMSVQSARNLRRRGDAGLFRAAWDAAVDYSAHLLEESSMTRSIHGVPRPIFYHGVQVGEWRYFDERLTLWLLRYRRPRRYGGQCPSMETPLNPDEDEAERLETLLFEFDAQILHEQDAATDPAAENSCHRDDA